MRLVQRTCVFETSPRPAELRPILAGRCGRDHQQTGRGEACRNLITDLHLPDVHHGTFFAWPAEPSFHHTENVVAFVDPVATAAGRPLELEMAVEKDAEGGIGGDVECDRDEIPFAADRAGLVGADLDP